MGGCFYCMSCCFAFVIVMLLCVCYFTSLSFVFSLLLPCPTLPVYKRAWLMTYCDLISLPRYAACKNIQLLHVCEIEHDELRLSLVYTPPICDPALSCHPGWPTAMQMRVKPAQAVRKERVDSYQSFWEVIRDSLRHHCPSHWCTFQFITTIYKDIHFLLSWPPDIFTSL